MKIKHYEGTTEQEIIERIKKELGPSAIIVSIKTIRPKGVFAVFKKPRVEVTAAYESPEEAKELALEPEFVMPVKFPGEPSVSKSISLNQMKERLIKDIHATDLQVKDIQIKEQSEKIRTLEENVTSAQEMLRRMAKKLSVERHRPFDPSTGAEKKYKNNILQVFYENFMEQGVAPAVAYELLDGLDVDISAIVDRPKGNNTETEDEKIDINFIVKIVYNKIVKMIGKPSLPVEGDEPYSAPFIATFLGPTGVGKTTTIAKLCADYTLNRGLMVSLISADTYRIAAIEQLKIYADILGLELGVVYNPADLQEQIKKTKDDYDVILIDSAGRSHKNGENMGELVEFLNVMPGCQKFLVLSLTTKYEDMLEIVNEYSKITDFRIIFTKLDETKTVGAVLNLCYETGKAVSYITFGQNVPSDIRVLNPEEIARSILSGL